MSTTGMTVVILGNGGRESALAYAIRHSPRVNRTIMIPGNAGWNDRIVEWLDLKAIVPILVDLHPDLVVVGPEAPLAAGIKDELAKRGIKTFGPSAEAAKLEASKLFMHEVARSAGVKTAKYRVATNQRELRAILKEASKPYVIKASGLRGGKGVLVTDSIKEAEEFSYYLFKPKDRAKPETHVLVEDAVDGPEYSVMAITDGVTIRVLPVARDYKRRFDDDVGPNTGGMGAFAPVPEANSVFLSLVAQRVFMPTLQEMAKRGTPFTGVLYAGLKGPLTDPTLLEFNVRFGDPETQTFIPLLDCDIVDFLLASLTPEGLRSLPPITLKPKRKAVCVALTAKPYPGLSVSGYPISGIEDAEKIAHVFHGGTAHKKGIILTDGGRVLYVVGEGESFAEASATAYQAANMISFTGMDMRLDIAAKVK